MALQSLLESELGIVNDNDLGLGHINGLKYHHNWNIYDFTGKSHISKYNNKLAPIPGTQIIRELKNINDKNNDIKRFENELDGYRKRWQHKQLGRDRIVAFSTKILFDTTVGVPLEEAREVIKAREILNNNKPKFPDPEHEILRFYKNVSLGRYLYIPSVVNLGFRSIDYQDQVNGDSGCHITSRKGDWRTLEELLKYRADPDLKNKYGRCAIHEAWFFWNTNANVVQPYRTKEERLDQEDKTIKIITAICSYGGFVDAQDQMGQSALHIACRLGPLSAVKTLLGFKADYMLKTKAGETPVELCRKCGHHEALRVIAFWNQIRHSMVHVDFSVLWHKFLKEYEVQMSNQRSAAAVLFDLEMESNIKTLDRAVKKHFQLDDEILRKVYVDSREANVVPKPWERGWSVFAKFCKDNHIDDMLDNMHKEQALIEKKTHKESDEEVVIDISNLHVDSLHLNSLQKRKFPDNPSPLPRPRSSNIENNPRLQNSVSNVAIISRKGSPNQMSRKLGPSSPTNSIEGSSAIVSTKSINDTETTVSSLDQFLDPNSWLESLEFSEQRPDSRQLQHRRIRTARAVGLDAKFQFFTTRPSSASALFLPIRTPNCPEYGTEEQGNIIRMIVSQGPEHEAAAKAKKTKFMIPGKSRLGHYTKGIEFQMSSERDALMSRVLLSNESVAAKAERELEQLKNSSSSDKGDKLFAGKKKKIQMINNKRAVMVDSELLPATNTTNFVQKMKKERSEAIEKERVKKEAIARAAMTSTLSGEDTGIQTEQSKKFNERNAQLFLKKKNVLYGKGRITSTHNSKGKLEEPWSTVSGRHSTLPGDRTQ